MASVVKRGLAGAIQALLLRSGTGYVWYTRIPVMTNGNNIPFYPSGYNGTIWYVTSTDAGRNWIEQGEALGRGEKGAFDSHAVFTPNIVYAEGKYYLFYTALKPTSGIQRKYLRTIPRLILPPSPWQWPAIRTVPLSGLTIIRS